MNDVVPGFPFNLFKPPLCATLTQIPIERVVKKLDTLSRSGSLTPLGRKAEGFDNDYDRVSLSTIPQTVSVYFQNFRFSRA